MLLVKMDAPANSVILGLLHDALQTKSSGLLTEIPQTFGDVLMARSESMKALKMDEDLLKKVNMDKDEDILLVKLAIRLHNMQTLKFLDESRWKTKANETLKIFSPLASKMGLDDLRLELDNLSMIHSK